MFDTHFKDINTYTARMEKSLIDKIYFIDKVDSTIFVDFGCADGMLLKAIQKLFPDYQYFGFDASEEMIAKAKVDSNILFTSSWDDIKNAIANLPGKKTLILSSILHEIYAYLSKTEIEEFWNKVWNTGFDYIVIRDMMVSETTSRPSDSIAVARIRQVFDKNKIAQWEAQWGSLTENWSLVHFLLTYHYTDNWEREYKENYLPNSLEKFMTMIPRKYYPEYIEHFTLPYIRNKVLADFNIQLQDRTHIKLVLKLSAN